MENFTLFIFGGGSVTGIQFVKSPFAQKEKNQVDIASRSFLLCIPMLHFFGIIIVVLYPEFQLSMSYGVTRVFY